MHIVQVNQDGDGALSPVLRKATSIFGRQIKGVKVLQILLRWIVAPHLGQFTMLDWFARQEGDFAHEIGDIVSIQVARGAGATGANLARSLAYDGRWLEGVLRRLNEKVTLVGRQKVFHAKDGWRVVEGLETRIVRIDAVVNLFCASGG